MNRRGKFVRLGCKICVVPHMKILMSMRDNSAGQYVVQKEVEWELE